MIHKIRYSWLGKNLLKPVFSKFLKRKKNYYPDYEIKTNKENNTEIKLLLENKILITAPAVSVIIPIYNAEEYLRQCLDSVIMQTLIKIEIICINDGSPDNSIEILKEYAKKDSRIIIISRENKGAAFSRNEGLQTAKGEFVIFMDADDWYPSELTLINLYSCAKKNNALICGGSLSRYINGKIVYDDSDSKTMFYKKGFLEYKKYQQSFYFQRFIYNREMIVKNNIFFPPYSHYEDPPFMIKAMITANKFYAVRSVVYRHREDYKTINFTDENTADILKGLKQCLVLSSENKLCKLHIFTANILFDNHYPFSVKLVSDKDQLLKLLEEFLSAADRNIINKNFITDTLNFFGLKELKYSKDTK
jgi:glycosyltransferase involved in cell wall biosynthesis